MFLTALISWNFAFPGFTEKCLKQSWAMPADMVRPVATKLGCIVFLCRMSLSLCLEKKILVIDNKYPVSAIYENLPNSCLATDWSEELSLLAESPNVIFTDKQNFKCHHLLCSFASWHVRVIRPKEIELCLLSSQTAQLAVAIPLPLQSCSLCRSWLDIWRMSLSAVCDKAQSQKNSKPHIGMPRAICSTIKTDCDQLNRHLTWPL